MKNPLVVVLSIVAVAAAGSAIVAAPQVRPGEMTKARVWVENRGSDEALPVTIDSMSLDARPLRVEVTGTPAISITPATIVQVRAVRQTWDHRVLTVPANQDVSAALSNAAADSWEAVGFQVSAQGSTAVLLKRPR